MQCWENTSLNENDFCKPSGQMLCGLSIFCVIISTWLVFMRMFTETDFIDVYKRWAILEKKILKMTQKKEGESIKYE